MKKSMKKLTRKTITVILALIVIGTPIAYLFLLNANNTQAAWLGSLSSRSGFNDNWAYFGNLATIKSI